jgi:uncharacterized protein YjiS (DUF1127 family)
MAYVNTNVNSSVLSRVLAATSGIIAALRKRQVYLSTQRELNGLSNRDLSDLGIHRSMIAEIAREAAYGK